MYLRLFIQRPPRLLQTKARCPLRGLQQVLEKLLQRHSIVVLRVVGAVKERHSSVVRRFENRRKTIFAMLQLREIPPAKFIPALGVMMKPFAQLRAWRHVFQPLSIRQRRFGDTSRPQAFYEKTRTIPFISLIVDALQLQRDLHLSHPLASGTSSQSRRDRFMKPRQCWIPDLSLDASGLAVASACPRDSGQRESPLSARSPRKPEAVSRQSASRVRRPAAPC